MESDFIFCETRTPTQKTSLRLSEEIEALLFTQNSCTTLQIKDIFNVAGERIYGVMAVFLGLTAAVPVPVSGYAFPFGILLLLLFFQFSFGRKHPWVPQRLMHYSISPGILYKNRFSGLRLLKQAEKICCKRWSKLCSGFLSQRLIGIFILFLSSLLLIPIPGSNTLPSLAIAMLGLSRIEKDGAFAMAGIALGILGAIVKFFIIIIGIDFFRSLIVK